LTLSCVDVIITWLDRTKRVIKRKLPVIGETG